MQALEAEYPGSAVTLDTGLRRELTVEFEARLAESSAMAFRVALGVLRNRADAEDVAQEAFLRAYRNFHRLRDRRRFRAWLMRIVWRLALDRRRAAARRERRELAAADPEPQPTAEELAASREFQLHLARAMDALPERFRQVLVLGAIEGHNMSELARLLGLSEGTAKSRLHHARRKLAEKLQWIVKPSEKS